MQTQGTESAQKQPTSWTGAAMGIAMIPVLFVGACVAIPYTLGARWLRLHGEHKLRSLMKSRGRLLAWPDFERVLHQTGGTCIEEKFTAKGPVRFWWTPEDVRRESPHEIANWITMRKGRHCEPFVHWCRARYTSADAGSAMLVDATRVPRREIYTLWSECRSDAMQAQWIEVAPPEILPRPVHNS